MKRFLPFFVIFFTLIFTFSGKVFASDTPIPQIHFPCNLATQPEFASLRPYQAAACGDADKALYCSNDLIFTEDFKIPGGQCASQGPPGDQEGQFDCILPSPQFVPDHSLVVDLANSSLPILGNTELTKNSQGSTDQIDDATKVNEYASWYLNGTLDRAEYGVNDPTKTVDYSGPIQKIMPQIILEAQRVATIASSSALTTYTPDNDEGAAAPQATTEPLNHNQIVVCYKKAITLLPAWFTNFFGMGASGLGQATPQDCYDGSGHMTGGLSILRLQSWDKSPFDVFADAVRPYLEALFPQDIVSQLIKSFTIDRWTEKTPPLPWADQNSKPFATAEAYQKAYNEWRGQYCADINFPLIGNKLFCAGIPGVTNNDFADLFPYIPLANTTDKHGSETDYIAEIKPSAGTQIAYPSYDTPKNAPLWFAHAEEVMNLSQFLNESYTPLDCTVTNGKQTCQPLANNPEPATTETNDCNVVNVRSNPGDNLFPGQTHGIIVPKVHYTITGARCDKRVVHDIIGKHPPHSVTRIEITCNAEVIITLPTVTKSPQVNEIYQNTVADSGSTFRKIYPKVETDAPVSCIADIPASTGVDYTGTDLVQGGTSDFKYKNPAIGSDNASELYFPHIGSVYDYFLKGIQTALRPQGFADPTPISGTDCSANSASGDCSWNLAKINAGVQAAASKYNVPASLLKAIFNIENADQINDPSKYQCTQKDQYGSIGVSQVTDDLYKQIACPSEQMQDVGMCGSYPGKLSRCNFGDAFELMARALLYKAGRLANCKPTGGIAESEKVVWYNAACDYYGTHSATQLTINYASDIPASERRQNGDMNYCDIVCWEMGQCSGSNYPSP